MARLSLLEHTARFDDNSTTAFPTNLKRSSLLSLFLNNLFLSLGIGVNPSTSVRHAVDAPRFSCVCIFRLFSGYVSQIMSSLVIGVPTTKLEIGHEMSCCVLLEVRSGRIVQSPSHSERTERQCSISRSRTIDHYTNCRDACLMSTFQLLTRTSMHLLCIGRLCFEDGASYVKHLTHIACSCKMVVSPGTGNSFS